MHRMAPRTHGYLDYMAIALFALAPTLFGFSGTPATLCYVVTVAYLGMCLLTNYPLGMARIIPFSVHGGVEAVLAVAFIAVPFLFGFSDVAEARNFFIAAGVGLGVVWSLTNYRVADQTMDRARFGTGPMRRTTV